MQTTPFYHVPTPWLTRDPAVILLNRTPEGREAIWCYISCVANAGNVGHQDTPSLDLLDGTTGYGPDHIRRVVDLTTKAAKAAGQEPWMTIRSGDIAHLRIAWEAYSTRGGARPGAGRKSKRNQSEFKDESKRAHMAIGSGCLESLSPEGECEGEPPAIPPPDDPAKWDELPAMRYAMQMRDHPFWQAHAAWKPEPDEPKAMHEWDNAVRVMAADPKWSPPYAMTLLGRVLAYVASPEGQKRSGTEIMGQLSTWLAPEGKGARKGWNKNDDAWNTKPAADARRNGAIAARDDRTFAAEQPVRPRRIG